MVLLCSRLLAILYNTHGSNWQSIDIHNTKNRQRVETSKFNDVLLVYIDSEHIRSVHLESEHIFQNFISFRIFKQLFDYLQANDVLAVLEQAIKRSSHWFHTDRSIFHYCFETWV